MEELAKPTRTYRSPLREQRAHQTSTHVMDAARGLFVEKGYAGTTIAAIAKQAGVSAETVYAVFGTKTRLLARLMHVAVTGDDNDVSLMEGPGPAAVHAATDQRELLRRFAGDITWRLERVGPLMEVVAAARNEPEIARLHTRLQRGRWDNLRTMVGWLAALGPLRLPADRAAETVWALASPGTFGLLSKERGWSSQEFETWLGESLVALLLP